MSGLGHHWPATCSNDGFLDVHRALDIVNQQVLSFLCSNHIVGQQCDQAVWIDEGSNLINSTDSVAVTIDTKAKFTPVLNDSVAQIDHVLWSCWVGTVVWLCSVPIAVQVHMVYAHLVEQFCHCGAWNCVATIDGNLDGSCD